MTITITPNILYYFNGLYSYYCNFRAKLPNKSMPNYRKIKKYPYIKYRVGWRLYFRILLLLGHNPRWSVSILFRFYLRWWFVSHIFVCLSMYIAISVPNYYKFLIFSRKFISSAYEIILSSSKNLSALMISSILPLS